MAAAPAADRPMTLAEFIARGARPAPAVADARPRHNYWFKTFQELVRDAEARTELEVLKRAIRAENPHAGTRVNGYPSLVAPARSFRFESFSPHDPHDTTIRTFLLDGETGNIRINPHRAGDLFISPALEVRILEFLRNHALTSNAWRIRRHALAGIARAAAAAAAAAPAVAAAPAAEAAAPVAPARRARRTRRSRKTRRNRK